MSFKNNLTKTKGYILIKGGKVYDPFLKINEKLDILIKNGIIEKINKNIPEKSSYNIFSCNNEIITNGFVDLHAHFRDPGYEDKETIETGANSAFNGGYTRVCLMPNTNPVIDTPELVRNTINKSINLPVHIYPIGAITKQQKGSELAEIGQMYNEGAIAISDDGIPVKNSQILRMALEYSKKFKIPVINHAEDNCLVNKGIVNEGQISLKMGLQGNPDISESTMVFRDLSIAEYVSGRIHVPHVSTEKSVNLIKEFLDKGVNITSEVTPHHLCLTDSIIESYDNNAKVAPPIRSERDRIALINGVKSGVINCIATDHAPHTIEDKEKDIHHAPCGMIGLESAFGLVNKVLNHEKMSIYSIIDLFTINPATIFNIKVNCIQEGVQAELNIINPNHKWIFTKESIHSKSKNSPVLGMELLGKVVATFNKGYSSYNKQN